MSGDRGHGAGRGCCRQHRRGKESKEGSTRYAEWSIKCIRVCVERCLLSTRHNAKPGRGQAQQRQLRERCEHPLPCHYSKLWRNVHPDANSIKLHRPRCSMAASRGHSHRVDHEGDGDVTHPSPDGCHSNTRLAATASVFYSVQETHAQRAEGVDGQAPSEPRAARVEEEDTWVSA